MTSRHPHSALPPGRTALTAVLSLALAVSFGLPAGGGTGVPAVDPSAAVTLEGPVVSFVAGPGLGLPTLTVEDAVKGETSVRLGPFRVLLEADFTAHEGDLVRVEAYPCPLCVAPYVAASVENLTTGASVVLRDEEGYPVWMASARGEGPGPEQGLGPAHRPDCPNCPSGPNDVNGPDDVDGPNGPNAGDVAGPGPVAGVGPGQRPGVGQGTCLGFGPDLGEVVTVSGTVVAFTGGPGVGIPLLTLETDDTEITLVVAPWRAWHAAGFLPQEGRQLEVSYAPVERHGETFYVALTVTDPATGLVVVLRDPETGRP